MRVKGLRIRIHIHHIPEIRTFASMTLVDGNYYTVYQTDVCFQRCMLTIDHISLHIFPTRNLRGFRYRILDAR